MWGCMFSVYPFSCDDWENIYTLSYYHYQIGSMNYYPLFRVRSWNNGVRCMSFYILKNLWYGRIASWDIRVLVVFAPNLPSVTDMQYYYHARYPTDDWHLAYMFLLVYFSVEVCLEGVFPHSVSTWRDSCVRVYACPPRPAPPPPPPIHAGFPPKIEQGGPSSLLEPREGYLNWRMGLPALLDGNLGCRIV